MRPAPQAAREHLAVFDVDETLIRCKSMFSFLSFCYSKVLGPAAGCDAYMRFEQDIASLAASQPREAVNRAFYQVFRGWKRTSIDHLAEAWFAHEMQFGLFHEEVLAVLRRHQAAGHRVVLLSGSADFILAPLAAYLQADRLLAIHLGQTSDGALTGQIEGIQTIGAGKRDALDALLAESAAAQPPVLHGYGDHESDAPFLARCDHRTVVLSHAAAPQQAAWRQDWPTLQLRPRLVH